MFKYLSILFIKQYINIPKNKKYFKCWNQIVTFLNLLTLFFRKDRVGPEIKILSKPRKNFSDQMKQWQIW